MSTESFQQPILSFDLSFTIAVGQNTSNAVDLIGTCLLALVTDANLTATSFTFLGCDTKNGAYLPMHKMVDGTIMTAVVAPSRRTPTNLSDFTSTRFLKLVSPVNQAGVDTTIGIVNRQVA
ncbi:MAG: hypothetical protein ACJAY9_000796 [Flavobacteriales bacterium]|jgi:hypothetical protein